jgi:hypothetical protein
VPAPHRPAPPERPDPVVLLIDAVINRQADLARRLGQLWIHRHGLQAFATMGRNRLIQTCGEDGQEWLHDLLGLPAQPDLSQPTPEPVGLGSLFREALSEALQPLRQNSPSPLSSQLPTAAAGVDPWEVPPLVNGNGVSRDAAPRPADLADLRAWLHSDAA